MYEKICPCCKTQLSQFYDTGMLGCPECYKVFEPEINNALKKIQGATFHTGKEPRLNELDKKLLDRYRVLLLEKETAGLEGRFADMAKLGEMISELADELKRRRLI